MHLSRIVSQPRGLGRVDARAFNKRGAHKDLATSAVETVASLILKSLLRQSSSVVVDVDTDGLSLLQGRIRAATLRGTDWESPARLTARELQFDLGDAAIDYMALMTQRQIVMCNEPLGSGKVLFTAEDFGNFLVHPLMVTAAARAVQGSSFTFDRSSVSLSMSPQPTVHFSGVSKSHARRYNITMTSEAEGQRSASSKASGNSKSVVLVARAASEQHVLGAPRLAAPGQGPNSPLQGDASAFTPEVSEDLTAFFNNLFIDLQGVHLRFASLAVVPCRRTNVPLLDLRLSVRMVAFPPLNVRF